MIFKAFASCLTLLAVASSASAQDQERAAFFAVPDFKELPPNIEVLSENTADGVKTTEFYMAGAPFNGQPTKIYAFYCRPEKDGKYPGVVEIHGAGLNVLGPNAGIEYAKNGFCSIVFDWCGATPNRKEPRKPPYSIYNGVGNMATPVPEAEKDKAQPHGWRSFGPEVDGIRNGVMFARRAVMFLKSRPEVEQDKLCVAGMSAGAHLTLLLLGVEPSFKAAAVKYGRGFIRDLYFGGYFGPMVMVSKEEQDAWLRFFDPKHGIPNYNAKVLLLSGTDDIFFWMPGVLVTYRAMPTDKRLLMFPNENHGYVGNVPIPLSWFKSQLGLAPAWPSPAVPKAALSGEELKFTVEVVSQAPVAKVSFWVKRMPQKLFRWGMGDKDKLETQARWIESQATLVNGVWTASIPAPAKDEQIVAYAMVETQDGVKDSSDTVEFPDYPQWRGLPAQPAKAAPEKADVQKEPAKAVKEEVAADGNLFLDSSFEVGKVGKIGSLYLNFAGTPQWDTSGVNAHSGKTAVAVSGRDKNFLAASSPVEGGVKYTLSGYFKVEHDGVPVRMQINWSAKGKFLKYDINTPKLTTEYQEASLVATAPDGSDSAFILITACGENDLVWMDDLFFGVKAK